MSTKPNSYISINPYTLDTGYWTNEELRALCETLGLSTSGNKTELIERYKSYYNNIDYNYGIDKNLLNEQ